MDGPNFLHSARSEFRSSPEGLRYHKTLQNFIYKHTTDLEKCTKVLGSKKENLKDIKSAQTRCNNLSISTTDCM
jgi:hypothetical protein